jgi:hypothetical protein
MALSIRGELIKVLDEQSGESARGTWRKCNFVVKTQEQYPKDVCIVAWGDKIDDVKRFKPGEIVEVFINIESREYNERWYTDVRMWRIEADGASQQQEGQFQNPPFPGEQPPVGQAPHPAQTGMQAPPQQDEADDLPF